MRYESLLADELEKLGRGGLLREPDEGADREQVRARAAELGLPLLDATSNDYLGLAQRVVSRETLNRAGAAASRLIHGTTPEHLHLEAGLAKWLGTEGALLFSSTYAANLGLISALGSAGSLIISDASNHASLIDGARLSKARVSIVPHLDLEAVRRTLSDARAESARWVITESYFSMDGDGPDLRELRTLCDEFEACLIVDEAHALGVFGPGGAGRCADVGVHPDILVGALGKAVGTHGGFVASSSLVRRYLWNKARSFVFSTALSPAHAALTLQQLHAVGEAQDRRHSLARNSARLRALIAEGGLNLIPGSFGPIISIILGENGRATQAASRLRQAGILAHAVRPPTVPSNSARLRVTVKATFTDSDIERLGSAVVEACAAS